MQGYAGSAEEQCGQAHKLDDPQFTGSACFNGYIQNMNHEIDIEIPANCMGTDNVCNNADGSCAGDYKYGLEHARGAEESGCRLSALMSTSLLLVLVACDDCDEVAITDVVTVCRGVWEVIPKGLDYRQHPPDCFTLHPCAVLCCCLRAAPPT